MHIWTVLIGFSGMHILKRRKCGAGRQMRREFQKGIVGGREVIGIMIDCIHD